MSTLARLRDLAGCRVVLRDAQEEQRPPEMIADLERVRQEAEDALWDGGQCALGFAMAGSSLVVRRVAPRRPDVSESAFHDAVYNFDADGEDTHAAWAVEMIAEWKSAVRRFQQSDLLAWRGQPRRQPRNMHEIDWASIGMSPPDHIWTAGETLSQPDRVNPAAAPGDLDGFAALYAREAISEMHRSLARAANPADVFGDGREWTRSLVPTEPPRPNPTTRTASRSG